MRELSFSHPVGEVDTTTLKIPPHSVEAEQSVLGGLMLDSSAWDRVADRVSQVWPRCRECGAFAEPALDFFLEHLRHSQNKK